MRLCPTCAPCLYVFVSKATGRTSKIKHITIAYFSRHGTVAFNKWSSLDPVLKAKNYAYVCSYDGCRDIVEITVWIPRLLYAILMTLDSPVSRMKACWSRGNCASKLVWGCKDDTMYIYILTLIFVATFVPQKGISSVTTPKGERGTVRVIFKMNSRTLSTPAL